VHMGVIMIAVALAASQSYNRQGEFTLNVGEQATVGGHTFTFVGTRVVDRPNRQELRALVRIDGGEVFEPASVRYVATGRTVGRPSVQVGPFDDRYLSLTREPTDSDPSIRLRIVVQPLIMWLWVGGFIMVLGTALAIFPGRRRRPTAPVSVIADDEPDESDERDERPVDRTPVDVAP